MAEHSAAEIAYTITIPAAAGQQAPGEYVAALLIDEQPAEESSAANTPGRGTITILPRVAIPVYVFLAGRETPKGRIVSLTADAPQAGTTRLLLTLVNDGDVHLRPTGSVLVTDAQGAVVARMPLGRTIPIFPRFQEGIPFLVPLAPGRYEAAATVQFGESDLLQHTLSFTVTADGRAQTNR